ncbi:hypothetical protein D3C75_209840 [compost metagenome]
MFTGKIKKSGLVVLSLLISLVGAGSASALNFNGAGGAGGGSGSGNKALNFNGYKFTNTDRNKLYLYFDKTLSSAQLDVSQFEVKEHGTATTVAVSSKTLTTGTGYSGCSDSQLDVGSTVVLTLASNLTYDKSYDVTLSPTIAANNGITLGNYYQHNDITFLIKTPTNAGAYTGTPAVTFLTDVLNSVSYEANIVAVVDRPISNTSTVLSSLSTNFVNGATTVTQDSTIDGTAVTGAEAYTPHANDEHNTLFFPLTGKGNANIAYNLDNSGSNSYTLTMPSFTDVSSNSYSGGSASFDTVDSDLSAWTDAVPTTSVSGSNVTVSWSGNSNTSITPAPYGYNVYYSSTPFGFNSNWTKWNGSIVTSTSYMNSLPSGTYYFRVVPIDAAAGGLESGFSLPTASAVVIP